VSGFGSYLFFKSGRFLVYLTTYLFALTCAACGFDRSPSVQELEVPAGDVTLYGGMVGGLDADRVLIAVNGGPGAPSDYIASLAQLAGQELAVITYDQRGAGRSTAPDDHAASYTLLKYVEDLEAVRRTVGAERIDLLGHSWGGLVALEYVALYPQRVSSLILYESSPPAWPELMAWTACFGQRIRDLGSLGIPVAGSLCSGIGPTLKSGK
jgi:pimeloyl-ACP methyl ester carboxylesterase